MDSLILIALLAAACICVLGGFVDNDEEDDHDNYY